jgi:hypothetical protein
VDNPLVESWNGSTWAAMAAPKPTPRATVVLYSVSCASSTSCKAVGEWSHGRRSNRDAGAFVESWNGSAWASVTTPRPADSRLSDVSCASPTSCTAVGSYGSEALVESWQPGKTWAVVTTPEPVGATESGLGGVFCVRSTTCTAVGISYDGSAAQTLVEETGFVQVAPTITSSSSEAFTQGVADSFIVATTGPEVSITESGLLPSGIGFVDNGDGTGTLSGDATESGVFPISFTASNGVLPDANQSFALTVNAPVTTWTQLSPTSNPGGLNAASMAYDAGTSQLVLFGGTPSDDTVVNGTWTWNGTAWSQLSPAASPPARENASMAYDSATDQLILFGGVAPGGNYFGDTWDWSGTTWTQLSPASSPPARSNASMSYDPATGQLILFGGLGTSTSVGDDTWSWNGSTWQQLSPATSPSARYRAPLTYDPATTQLVLFGGTAAGGTPPLADTWTWTGTTWDQLSPATSPPPRGYGALTFDPITEQLVLFGGIATAALGDTWSWNGSAWAQLSPGTSPSARYRSAVAYDPASAQLVLYGGSSSSSTYLDDTWSYGPVPPVAPTAPTIGTASRGNAQATVSFNPPANNGGAPVNNYTVTATDQTTPANGGETATGPASPITVTGLTNGDSYTFTVTATNSAGTGPPSAVSNAVVPATVPDAPTIGTATAGNAQATVSFNPPANNGGAAVSSYRVTATDETTAAKGETASGPASPITVTGLTNGDSYTFTVTATNSAGTGTPSAASNAVVPATVPDAPTIGTATPGNAQATVTFAAPGYDGGAPVNNYTVTATDQTTPANGGETATGPASPITVTGLTNGDSYTFTVTATNSAGTGTPSAASNAVVPTAPISITSITPSQLAQGAKGDLVIDGTGFESPLSVSISGGGVTPALLNVTPNAVTITATVNALAVLGVRDVTVSDSNGTITCTNCLTIIAAPTLTEISPSSAAQDTSTPVTLTGTGFAPGAQLKAPKGVTFTQVTVVNSTTITATMKVSATAPTGTNLAVTVTNNAAAGYGHDTGKILTVT